MPTEPVLLEEPASIPLPKSPIVRINSQPLPTDSMVSIALSDPVPDTILEDEIETASNASSEVTVEPIRTSNSRRSSASIFSGVDLETEINGGPNGESAIIGSPQEPDSSELEAAAAALEGKPRSRRPTCNSEASEGSSDDDIPVDWEELEKNEESEPRDEASDEVGTATWNILSQSLTYVVANGLLACSSRTRKSSSC